VNRTKRNVFVHHCIDVCPHRMWNTFSGAVRTFFCDMQSLCFLSSNLSFIVSDLVWIWSAS